MKYREIRYKDSSNKYSVIIGENILSILPRKIKECCPKTKKIVLIIDVKVPKKFKKILRIKLKKYELIFLSFKASEKNKTIKTASFFVSKLLSKNLNRSDLVIGVGGGITGDLIGFVASIFKRGINFINIPTTLLAQVDASIGGKSGVNSFAGKNLIGSFYQPILVLSDSCFLKSLPKKEMICGYAEILKHAIIKDKKFFNWLKLYSQKVLSKQPKELVYAINKSCEIKMDIVRRDVNEKSLRMILNFGHTFAHAIEVKNNYSTNITHGEAVLSGIILATRLSHILKVCKKNDLTEIVEIYNKNNLSYTFKNFSKKNFISNLIPFLENDKKNNDDKINFILLKKIGKTTMPNKNKISLNAIKKYSKIMAQY